MMTIVTGGSGSGKSAYAEDCLVSHELPGYIYIATMYPFDEESHRRIHRHRAMRAGKGFKTIECYTGIGKLKVPQGSGVLLECMSNLAANEMFREEGAGVHTAEAVIEGVKSLRSQAGHLCIVTNEIFSDGAAYDPETVRYQKYLGEINRQLGKMADRVVEVVYGIPLAIKGGAYEDFVEQF